MPNESLTSDRADLTIGLPVRNEEENIERVIQQLQKQTFGNFLLLISDNASTDGTDKICQKYAELDGRIHYVRHSTNKGSLFNFKFVLEEAATPYFMWAGGHDGWHPRFCEKLINELERNQNLVLAYPKTREILENGDYGHVFDDDHTTVSVEKPEKRFLHILKEVSVCNLFHGIWRTDVLKKYRLRKVIGPDKILLTQMALEGPFKQVGEVLFFRNKKRKIKNIRKLWGYRMAGMKGTDYRKLTTVEVIYLKIIFLKILLDTLFQKDVPLGKLAKPKVFLKTVFIVGRQFFVLPALKKIGLVS